MANAHRERTALAGLAFSGALLVLFGQWLISSMPGESTLGSALPQLVGAGLFVASVIMVSSRKAPKWMIRTLDAIPEWMHVHPWQVTALVAALPLAAIAAMAAGSDAKMINPALALASWVVAITLSVAGGLSLGPRISRDPVKASKRARSSTAGRASAVGRTSLGSRLAASRWEIAGLTLLGVVAFALRAWNTTHIPIFLTGDEGSAGLEAVRALKGEINNIFAAGWYGFPQLYFVVQSLSLRVLGVTTAAIRLPSALIGALTVVGTYILAKALFGSRAGWVSAIFLAGFHYHIHFSRIALNNVWDGLWYVVALAAFWVAWTQNRRLGYIIAGLSVGLSQYFYSSARALIAVLVIWLLLAAILDRARLKRSAPNLVIMLVCAMVVALPSFWDFARRPDEYLAPFRRFSIFGPWAANEIGATGQPFVLVLLNQAVKGLGSYTFLPLQAWYKPESPMLRWLPATGFILGVLLLAVRWREDRSRLLLLWLLAFVGIASLSDSTPAAQRLVAAAPACAIVIGFAVQQATGPIERRFPRRSMLVTTVAVAIALGMALDDVNFYFNVYTPRVPLELAHTNDAVAQALADSLRGKPADCQVVFLGSGMGFYSIPSIQYLDPQITGVDISQPWGDAKNPKVAGNHLLFVFMPGRDPEIGAVEAAFPGGTLTTVPAVDGNPLYWSYEWQAASGWEPFLAAGTRGGESQELASVVE